MRNSGCMRRIVKKIYILKLCEIFSESFLQNFYEISLQSYKYLNPLMPGGNKKVTCT